MYLSEEDGYVYYLFLKTELFLFKLGQWLSALTAQSVPQRPAGVFSGSSFYSICCQMGGVEEAERFPFCGIRKERLLVCLSRKDHLHVSF